MIKSIVATRVLKLAFYWLIIASCSKDPFPSIININLGENVVFDATEEQIIRVDTDGSNMEFKIASIDNTLCPEGVMCCMMGSAILTVEPIFNMNDLITVCYPSNVNISDSVQFTFEDQAYYIKLLSVKKEFYNKRKTKTKSVVDLLIESI